MCHRIFACVIGNVVINQLTTINPQAPQILAVNSNDIVSLPVGVWKTRGSLEVMDLIQPERCETRFFYWEDTSYNYVAITCISRKFSKQQILFLTDISGNTAK